MLRDVILFDLDGTLTDPEEGITRSLQYALDKCGVHIEDRSTLRRFIGPPLFDTFENAFGQSHEQAERTIVYYREYFATRGLFENRVYDGIPELLAELKARGFRLAVATSKPEEFSRRIIEHFGMAEFFDFIAGAAMDETRGTKSEVIEWALTNLGITDRSRVVMVGDRMYDVEGARKCGLPCVGVLFGFGGREELESAGAAAIAADCAELLEILTR